MDESLKVTDRKNESILMNLLQIPTEMNVNSVKQESNCLLQSEIQIKTKQEDKGEFLVIAGTSYERYPYDDMKIETDEPMIKIECEGVVDELMQDPLDVGDEIKDEKYFLIDLDVEPRIKSERTERENDEQVIRNYLNRRDKRYVCDECNKTFKWKCYLDKHLRTHTGIKPYTCNICEKSFYFKGSLDKHALIHTGRKSHVCDVCQKCFTQKGALNTHMRIHSGEKPHICDVCKRYFKEKGYLDSHKLVHSGEKPFSCKECDRSFSHKHHLVIHTRQHTGDKPYACDVCKKAFARKSHLTAHRRTHTGEKPFFCHICNISFSHKSAADRHKKNHNK